MWTNTTLVIASGNRGKIEGILKPFWRLCDRGGLSGRARNSVTEETGLSFIENALLKARHASAITHLPSLADDSGLVIPALDGAPGLYSARYAGVNASDQDNVSLLLERMKYLSGDNRLGCYICALALIRNASDPDPLVVVGRWQGKITRAPRGDSGFGYDPVFLPDNLDQTAAEIDPQVKISSVTGVKLSSN